jgi:hypothetical protein
LLLNGQPIEVFDDLIGLAAVALVSPDGVNQVGRTPIMGVGGASNRMKLANASMSEMIK